ncbi:MAG: RMD1 family protein [Polyangiaceae bacterium]
MSSHDDAARTALPSIPPEAELVHVAAYGIKSTFDVKHVRSVFDGAKRVRLSMTELAAFYDDDPAGRKCVFVHDFGAIVFFDFDEPERKALLAKLFATIGPETRAPVVDDFLVVVQKTPILDPLGRAVTRPTARFDRLVVAHYSPELAELVSVVVGQSVGMEYYEDDVAAILGRIDVLTREFADQGAFRGRMRDLTKFIGEAMILRNDVIQTLALLDAPPSAWDDESLDRAYRELRSAFAIEDRYRALDQKLAMIRDHLELVLDVARHRTSLIVEVGVAVLILVEVVLFVVEMVRR